MKPADGLVSSFPVSEVWPKAVEVLKSAWHNDKILNFFAKKYGGVEKTLKKVWYVNNLFYLCGVFEA